MATAKKQEQINPESRQLAIQRVANGWLIQDLGDNEHFVATTSGEVSSLLHKWANAQSTLEKA